MGTQLKVFKSVVCSYGDLEISTELPTAVLLSAAMYMLCIDVLVL